MRAIADTNAHPDGEPFANTDADALAEPIAIPESVGISVAGSIADARDEPEHDRRRLQRRLDRRSRQPALQPDDHQPGARHGTAWRQRAGQLQRLHQRVRLGRLVLRLSPRDEVAASVEFWQLWQRVSGYTDPTVAFNPFDATIATGTDHTSLVKLGGQWTHLFGSSVEAKVNGGWVQSFATHSGIVATVTGNGTVVPTIGNQGWFEYGSRLGFRFAQGWIVDLFANGTLGPQPVGNTIHGGVGLRINY